MEPPLSLCKELLEDVNAEEHSKSKMPHSLDSTPGQSTISGWACKAALLHLTKPAQHTHIKTP